MIAEAKLLDHLQALGLATSGASLHVCQGGDIHQSYRLQNLSGHEPLFIKVNTANHAAVLRSEFQSLEKMAELFDGGYPLAMHFYADSEFALLAMRYHELEPLSSATARAAWALTCHTTQRYALKLWVVPRKPYWPYTANERLA